MAITNQPVVNAQADTQTTKRDFRQEVTDSIVQMLEQGVAPWQKPWESAGSAFEMPVNPTTEKSYRGGNAIHLMATALRRGYDDPRWMTYRQAAENGWQVRKGEKGTQIEFWEIRDRSADSHTSDPSEDRSEISSKSKSAEERRLIHRVYTVFDAKQIDGIPEHKTEQHSAFEAVQAGEQILRNSCAHIAHDQADRAFYNRHNDRIHLPPKDSFKGAPAYYGTALHELAHNADIGITHTSYSIAVNVAPRPITSFVRPKPKRLHTLSRQRLDSIPARRVATISNFTQATRPR